MPMVELDGEGGSGVGGVAVPDVGIAFVCDGDVLVSDCWWYMILYI